MWHLFQMVVVIRFFRVPKQAQGLPGGDASLRNRLLEKNAKRLKAFERTQKQDRASWKAQCTVTHVNTLKNTWTGIRRRTIFTAGTMSEIYINSIFNGSIQAKPQSFGYLVVVRTTRKANKLLKLYFTAQRKFRNFSSDNMDSCSNSGESSQRRDRKKREDHAEKIEKRKAEERRSRCAERQKSRETLCFSNACGPGGEVGSLKRRVRSHLRKWEMQNCALQWHEAHVEVKMLKNTSTSERFWTLSSWKGARRCGAKHIWKSKW